MLFYVVAPGLSSANTNASLVKFFFFFFFFLFCVCVCGYTEGVLFIIIWD